MHKVFYPYCQLIRTLFCAAEQLCVSFVGKSMEWLSYLVAENPLTISKKIYMYYNRVVSYCLKLNCVGHFILRFP